MRCLVRSVRQSLDGLDEFAVAKALKRAAVDRDLFGHLEGTGGEDRVDSSQPDCLALHLDRAAVEADRERRRPVAQAQHLRAVAETFMYGDHLAGVVPSQP